MIIPFAQLQILITTIALLALNGLVIALYIVEYNKNKKLLISQDKLLRENKEAINALNQTIGLDQKVLDSVKANIDAVKNIADAKAKAAEIVNQVSGRSEAVFNDIVKLQQETVQRFNQQEKQLEETYTTILDAVKNQATQALQPTITFNEGLKQKMDQALDNAVDQAKTQMTDKIAGFLDTYQNALINTQTEHIKKLQNNNKVIDENINTLTEQFIDEMKQRIITLGNERRTYMESELADIQTKLDDFKQRQMEKIENNIYEILARASESVVGQAVSLDAHQELIIKALEQAKRESVFI